MLPNAYSKCSFYDDVSGTRNHRGGGVWKMVIFEDREKERKITVCPRRLRFLDFIMYSYYRYVWYAQSHTSRKRSSVRPNIYEIVKSRRIHCLSRELKSRLKACTTCTLHSIFNWATCATPQERLVSCPIATLVAAYGVWRCTILFRYGFLILYPLSARRYKPKDFFLNLNLVWNMFELRDVQLTNFTLFDRIILEK